jgi:hypothetical protein
MRKGWMIAIIALLLLMIGIVAGFYVFKINQTQDNNMLEDKQLAEEQENKETEINNVIATSVIEEKTSPNTIFTQKQYFKGCDHIQKETTEISEEDINLTQEQMQKQYPDWKIEKFSSNEVVLYKEKNGYCDEHYVIREHNGVLAIYTLDENGKETWKQDTEIVTMYLPEVDLSRIKEGIKVTGTTNLRSILEDYE